MCGSDELRPTTLPPVMYAKQYHGCYRNMTACYARYLMHATAEKAEPRPTELYVISQTVLILLLKCLPVEGVYTTISKNTSLCYELKPVAACSLMPTSPPTCGRPCERLARDLSLFLLLIAGDHAVTVCSLAGGGGATRSLPGVAGGGAPELDCWISCAGRRSWGRRKLCTGRQDAAAELWNLLLS